MADPEASRALAAKLRKAAGSVVSRKERMDAIEAGGADPLPVSPQPLPMSVGAVPAMPPSVGGIAAGDPRMTPQAQAALVRMLRARTGAALSPQEAAAMLPR